MLAGGISDGHALRAAQALGCDLAYMGTNLIATRESMADIRYKELLVASTADDVLLTTGVHGPADEHAAAVDRGSRAPSG